MNLTIALRVIGGFAITSLLLLILGINSVSVLDDISDSTDQVNQTSIPALATSSSLQRIFVEMSKTALLNFYAEDYQGVEQTRAQFDRQASEYKKQFAQLQTTIMEDPELSKSLPKVSDVYNKFNDTAYQLFDSKKSTLQYAEQVMESFEETEFAADDASTFILDFVDLNELEDSAPAIAEVSTDLETAMVSVISKVTDLSEETDKTTVETIIKELFYTKEAVNKGLVKLKESLKGKDYEGQSDVIEQVEAVRSLLNSSTSVQASKSNWVAQKQKTADLLAQTNELISAGVAELDALAKNVDASLLTMKTSLADDVSTGIVASGVVMGVSLVVSVFIAFITVIGVTRPLDKVNKVLQIVATGDLTTRLDDSSKDEFGILARNCNTLIENLRELITGIVHRSNQLATASEQTSMIVKESTIAINDQRSQVEQAATATAEMAATSESVMDRANEALNDIKHADEEAERVKEISNVNKQTIIQLASEVDQASTVIDEVNQHSAAIGGILDVIRGVAEQTNLLALNAAIEAARAGEQGRGFAVVADEVRSLASKTQESTEEIQSMIEQLQRGSKSAVSVMNNSKNQAELCVEQTEQAAQALEGITDSVHQANDMSEQIVTAANEQNQVSSEISERLESIVTIAEQTASGAEQTELSSQEVAKLAEELRTSVDQFKL